MASLLFVLVAACGAVAPALGRVVSIEDGPVDGIEANGVASWLGIPFAEPPVGDLRWRPPQEPKQWGPNVRSAAKLGPDCTQAVFYGIYSTDKLPGTSEDCLYINVYAPSEQPSSPKPVLLWIYGGGFNGGGSSIYNGTYDVALARGELILVTFNYRLAVFGFAASARLRHRDPEGGTGNYGILDQRMAMRWTQRNIAAFGGDPSRVLLVGESAGGDSVSNHLVRRKSWGLFSAAGVDSGSFYSLQPQVKVTTVPPMPSMGPTPANVTVEQQEPHFDALLAAAACGDVDCMLKLSDEALLRAMFKAAAPAPWLWEPTIDGVDLVASGVALAADGVLAPVPLMVGSNMEDGALMPDNCDPATCTEEDFRKFLASSTSFSADDIERAVAAYAGEGPRAIGSGWSKWYAAEAHLGADPMMTCPARRLARWVTKAGQNAYWYYWAYTPKLPNGTAMPSTHGSEVPFLFHDRIQPSEMSISAAFVRLWASFAADGRPSAEEEWRAYDSATEAALVIGEDMTIALAEHHRSLICDFWDEHAQHWQDRSSMYTTMYV